MRLYRKKKPKKIFKHKCGETFTFRLQTLMRSVFFTKGRATVVIKSLGQPTLFKPQADFCLVSRNGLLYRINLKQ